MHPAGMQGLGSRWGTGDKLQKRRHGGKSEKPPRCFLPNRFLLRVHGAVGQTDFSITFAMWSDWSQERIAMGVFRCMSHCRVRTRVQLSIALHSTPG